LGRQAKTDTIDNSITPGTFYRTMDLIVSPMRLASRGRATYVFTFHVPASRCWPPSMCRIRTLCKKPVVWIAPVLGAVTFLTAPDLLPGTVTIRSQDYDMIEIFAERLAPDDNDLFRSDARTGFVSWDSYPELVKRHCVYCRKIGNEVRTFGWPRAVTRWSRTRRTPAASAAATCT
jgi:hypothetical protein